MSQEQPPILSLYFAVITCSMWYSLSRRRVRAQPYGYLFLRTSFSAFGAFNYKYTPVEAYSIHLSSLPSSTSSRPALWRLSGPGLSQLAATAAVGRILSYSPSGL